MNYVDLANKCARMVNAKPPPKKWAQEALLKEVRECLAACVEVNGSINDFKPYQVSALLALEEQLKEKEKELLALIAEDDAHD